MGSLTTEKQQYNLWRWAKRRAEDKGLLFNIKVDDIEIPDVCPCLGIKLKVSSKRSSYNSPSLDRIIPELGYIKGNVIVVSLKANRIKSNGTPEEIRRVSDFYMDVIVNRKE